MCRHTSPECDSLWTAVDRLSAVGSVSLLPDGLMQAPVDTDPVLEALSEPLAAIEMYLLGNHGPMPSGLSQCIAASYLVKGDSMVVPSNAGAFNVFGEVQ